MRIIRLPLYPILVLLVACASQPPVSPTQTILATTTQTPGAEPSIAASPTPTLAASPTPTLAATPTTPSGTIVTDDGQNLQLSQPRAYWKLQLPRTWVITSDTGYQIKANNPEQTAFVHLVSQMWDQSDVRPATGQNYVDYWKNSPLGDAFPVFADGDQKSETPINQEKFGGPYLRYEFDDAKTGWDYMQVYASAGGPNSLVVTAMAKTADFGNEQTVLGAILNSAELVPGP